MRKSLFSLAFSLPRTFVTIRHCNFMSTATKYPDKLGSYEKVVGPIDLTALYSKSGNKSNVQAALGEKTLTTWKSKTSGLTVTLIDAPSPLVHLWSVVATEIFDDSGVPHTLEHLIFLGSEQYPYKGVLDTLANRAFADGTNAWTANTHTAYTISTAGSEGFLRILPVYLDHQLYPTITDEGFTTEVYHINGKGEDSGVVFSEMQARENTPYDQMALSAQRAMYPEGSAYRSETGGLMSALRVLTADQIRQYHGKTYLPHNMCVVVAGKVDPTKLLTVLENEVEPRIAKHGQNQGSRPPGWVRPWTETASAQNGGAPVFQDGKDAVKTIQFPENDESVAEWQKVWTAVPYNAHLESTALDILGTYLSDSAVSPLQKALVEIPEPLCTDISFDIADALTSTITLMASSVPTEHVDTFGERVQDVFESVLKQGIDMDRMNMVIDRDELKFLSSLEKNPGNALSQTVIDDFLFGTREPKDFEDALQTGYDTLRTWAADQWAAFLRKYLVDAPALTVIGKPSATLAEKLEADTEKMIQDNKARFGEKGLKKLEEELERAKKVNDRPIPDDMISSFPIPVIESIKFIEVESARATPNWAKGPVQAHVDKDQTSLPYFVQFDHVSSDFITLSTYFFPQLPKHLRPLLSLYASSFFSLPIKQKDGSVLPFDKVIARLDSETISYSIHVGYPLSEGIFLSFRVEKAKYDNAVAWTNDLLLNSVFDVERLIVTASKNVQNLPSEKREGDSVASSAAVQLTRDTSKSIKVAYDLLSRNDYEAQVLAQLKEDPEAVVAKLEELRACLSRTDTMRASVVGDVLSLPNPKLTWAQHFSPPVKSPLLPVPLGRDTLSKLGRHPAKKAVIYAMASIESTYANHIALGPSGYDHPDRPALMVTCGLLNALESYLWRYIRGSGLAYGAWMVENAETSLVTFSIYKSPDAAKAFTAAKKMIDDLVSGQIKIDQLTLESAKSTLAYSTASSVANQASAGAMSFINQALLGLPQQYQRDLLAKAADVTIDDCVRMLKQYIAKIFDPATSIAAIAASKTKAEPVADALKQIGYDAEIRIIESNDEESGSESGSEMSVDSDA